MRYLLLIIIITYFSLIGQENIQVINPANHLFFSKSEIKNSLNVGSTGDYGKSILLVDIPVLSETSYKLFANYAAGIRPSQQASEIGLGWSLPIGKITRIIKGKNDESHSSDQYPDRFVCNVNGSSMLFSNFESVLTPDIRFNKMNGWTIIPQYDASNINKILSFRAIDPTGVIYDFNKPLYSESYDDFYAIHAGYTEWLLTSIYYPQSDASINFEYLPVERYHYLMPQFVDCSPDNLESLGPNPTIYEDHLPLPAGKVGYQVWGVTPTTYDPIAKNFMALGDHLVDFLYPLAREITYVEKIITPHYEVVFDYSDRDENYLSFFESQRVYRDAQHNQLPESDLTSYERLSQLNSIIVSHKNTNKTIKKILFNYESSDAEKLAPTSYIDETSLYNYAEMSAIYIPQNIADKGRLTLKNIEFMNTEFNSDSYSYQFSYNTEKGGQRFKATINPFAGMDWGQDFYGFRNIADNEYETDAYCLNKIEYPDGLIEKINYEYKVFNYPFLPSPATWASGVRIDEITFTYDNESQEQTIKITPYGGKLNSFPYCWSKPEQKRFGFNFTSAVVHYDSIVIEYGNQEIHKVFVNEHEDEGDENWYNDNNYFYGNWGINNGTIIRQTNYKKSGETILKTSEVNYNYDISINTIPHVPTSMSNSVTAYIHYNTIEKRKYLDNGTDFISYLTLFDYGQDINYLNNLPSSISESQRNHFPVKVTSFEYACESNPDMENDNFISQVRDKKIFEQDIVGTQVIKQFERTNFISGNPYYEDEKLVNNNGIWTTLSSVSSRLNDTGLPTEITDPNGNILTIKYGYEDFLPIAIFKNAYNNEIFFDNFDDSDLLPEWWSYDETKWENINGELYNKRFDYLDYIHPFIPGGISQTNSIIEGFITIHSAMNPTDWAGFHFKKDDYEDDLDDSGYILILRQNGQVQLLRTSNEILGTSDLDEEIIPGRKYHLSISLAGSNIQIKLDGKILFEVNDNGETGLLFGLAKYKCMASFDDIAIYPSDAYCSPISYDSDFTVINRNYMGSGSFVEVIFDNFGKPIQSVSNQNILIGEYKYFNSNKLYSGYDNSKPSFNEAIIYNEQLSLEGLIGDWGLEGNALDASQYKHHGSFEGDPNFEPGFHGGCYWFNDPDDTDDYDAIIIPHSEIQTELLALTIMAWVYPGENTTSGDIILNKEGEYEIGWKSGGQLITAIDTDDPSNWFWTGGTGYNTLPQVEWNHVTVTWDGVYIREYINGELKRTTNQPGNKTDFSSSPIKIGRRSYVGQYYWDGKIDEVKLFSRALSQEEINIYLKYSSEKSFVKPLTEITQSQLSTKDYKYVITIENDQYGRAIKSWLPTIIYGRSPDYILNYSSYPLSEYDGSPAVDCGGYPYSEFIYNNPFNNDLEAVSFAGTVFRLGQGNEITYNYTKTSPVDGTSNEYIKARQINEDNVKYDSYLDMRGNLVASVQNRTSGTGVDQNLLTSYQYDALDRIIKTTNPNGFISNTSGDISEITASSNFSTYYKYDNLGRMIAKTTPDHDGDGNNISYDEGIDSNPDFEYRYDNSGNLRFYEDPNIKNSSNTFYYHKYDKLSRIIESGIYDGSVTFSSADPTTTGLSESDFPTVNTSLLFTYQYDKSDDFEARNLRGRLASVEIYDPSSSTILSDKYYSYDQIGNLEWTKISIMGILTKKIEYENDNAGKVLKMTINSDEYHFWYEYDALGRLESVYAAFLNSKPNEAEVKYEYWSDGSVKTIFLGEKPGGQYTEVLDYKYNERGWLSSINSPSGLESMASGKKFAMNLYYNSGPGVPLYNGNISGMDVYTPTGETSYDQISADRTRYLFSYDDINRLTNANSYYYTGSNWTDHGGYDTEYVYDLVGNFLELNRNNEYGGAVPFNYHYYTNSNKLDYVNGLNQSSNNYAYDPNGNLSTDNSKSITSNNPIEYNFQNLPLSITNQSTNATLEFMYDNNGNRIYKKLDNETTGYLYLNDENGQTIAVYDTDGKLLFYNLYGLDLVGRIHIHD